MVRGRAIFVVAAAGLLWSGVAAAQAAGEGATVPVNASITVLDPVQLSQATALAEGEAIRRPANGAAVAPVPGATYTLRGLGGETYNVSTPQAITVTRAGGDEQLQLTLTPSQTTAAMPGAAGAPSSTSIAVTATVPVTSQTAGGAYVGRYGLTVSYP